MQPGRKILAGKELGRTDRRRCVALESVKLDDLGHVSSVGLTHELFVKINPNLYTDVKHQAIFIMTYD